VPGRLRVWSALLIASLGWGSAGIATRAALREGLEPYQIAAMRAVLAAFVVAAVLVASGRGIAGRRRWTIGLVLGSANMAVPFVLTALAVQHASAGFVGLLVANIPIATALWAHVVLPDDRLTAAKAAGLAVSVGGIVVLMAGGDSGIGEGGDPLLAVALASAGLLAASYGAVHVKRFAPDLGALELAGPQFAVGAAIMIPLMLVMTGMPEGTAAGWWLIAYLGTVGTVMPFVLFYWALREVTATEASLVGYIVPIVGLIGGAVVLGERISAVIAAGGALILCGVVLTERASRRAVQPAPSAAADHG